jgi:hypothetical protein
MGKIEWFFPITWKYAETSKNIHMLWDSIREFCEDYKIAPPFDLVQPRTRTHIYWAEYSWIPILFYALFRCSLCMSKPAKLHVTFWWIESWNVSSMAQNCWL